MREHDKVILDRIKYYALLTVQFKGDMDFSGFSKDAKTIAACVFSLSQIGELVGKLDNQFVEENNHIPWRKIKGLRNKIVHDYERNTTQHCLGCSGGFCSTVNGRY